jgi:hypothetical protein
MVQVINPFLFVSERTGNVISKENSVMVDDVPRQVPTGHSVLAIEV